MNSSRPFPLAAALWGIMVLAALAFAHVADSRNLLHVSRSDLATLPLDTIFKAEAAFYGIPLPQGVTETPIMQMTDDPIQRARFWGRGDIAVFDGEVAQ